MNKLNIIYLFLVLSSFLFICACNKENSSVIRFTPDVMFLGAGGGTFKTVLSEPAEAVMMRLATLDADGNVTGYEPIYASEGICTVEHLDGTTLSVTVGACDEMRRIELTNTREGHCTIYQNY